MRVARVKDTAPDFGELLKSWRRHLEAGRRSPHTIKSYTDGVTSYLRWCQAAGRVPDLAEDTVTGWVGSMHAQGRAGWTVVSRQAAVRRFSKWLARKDYIPADLLAGLERPRLDEAAVIPLTDAEVRALLATCKGRAFHDIRDRAAIMLMHETGLRASEVVAMTLADVNLDARLAVIRRGKGGKGRLVRFSPQCCAAFDDYLHARKRHRLAASEMFWLGGDGRAFGYHGLYLAVKRRGKRIGIDGLHPHQLRNTAAVRWLRKGGTTSGLMAMAGWASVDMLRRYIQAAESQLAAEEADRLDLGGP